MIDKQIKTVHDGAERYIKNGSGIFVDKNLKIPFPIDINRENMVIHKIIVVHGIEEAFKSHENDNTYGIFYISYGNNDKDLSPFVINIDKENPVHVFDGLGFSIVLGELDTYCDFSSYLNAKVKAINSCNRLDYYREEYLLARYYSGFDEAKQKHFIRIGGENSNHTVKLGTWKQFSETEWYKNKKEADKISYFWDVMIQEISQSMFNDNMHKSSSNINSSSVKKGISPTYEMAKEPRFFRRILSENITQQIKCFSKHSLSSQLFIMPLPCKEKGYILLQLRSGKIPEKDSCDYEK